MTAYATLADLYKYGLPRGALGSNQGRLVASSLAATSTIELSEHGFVVGDQVTTRATDGGTLSAPLVAGTPYYVLPITESTFQLSATPGGSAITLTSDGVSMAITADLPTDALLERYSRFADGFLPAHAVPLPSPYPVEVVAVVCELTARKLQILSGMTSETMKDAEVSAMAQLQRYAKGIPVPSVAKGTVAANLAIVRSACGEETIGRPLGWRSWE